MQSFLIFFIVILNLCQFTPTTQLLLLEESHAGWAVARQLPAVGTVMSRISFDFYHLLRMSREAQIKPTGS